MSDTSVSVRVEADGWATVRWRIEVGPGDTDVPVAMPSDAVESFLGSWVVLEHGDDPMPAVGLMAEPAPGIVLQVRSVSGGVFVLEWRLPTAGWRGGLRWHGAGDRMGWQAWVRLPAFPGLPGGPASWSVVDAVGRVVAGEQAWELTSPAGTVVSCGGGVVDAISVLRWRADPDGGHLVRSVAARRSELIPDWASGWDIDCAAGCRISEDVVAGDWVVLDSAAPDGVRVVCAVDERPEGPCVVVRTGIELESREAVLRRSSFRLCNGSRGTVSVLVADALESSWHRIAPEEPNLSGEPFSGFVLVADAGSEAELVVVETGSRVRRTGLMKTSPDSLAQWLDAVALDEDLRRVVDVVLARRRRIDEWEQRVALRTPDLQALEDVVSRLSEKASLLDPDSAAAKQVAAELRQGRESAQGLRAQLTDWATSAERARQELRNWLETQEAGR